jgi:site-specific recombinase XerD
MELQLGVAAQPGHRIGPRQVGRELQLRVLARGKLQRLVRLQAQAADVVREHVDARDRRLQDARRMHHDLVGLRDLDGAALGQRGLAGQHVALALAVGAVRADGVLSAVEHLARHHLAAAGAAAPRHAAVGHRHVVLAQHFEQVRAGANLERAGQGVNVQVHRGFLLRRRGAGLSLGGDDARPLPIDQ